ncbi:hypothetical protein O181_050949 [Austropuccinia psidii MF-1]|uniref:Uncharacterized protein n=1 Tax=Austropuccinia psidii MF-1 TaxID=1389203 RepID=A0A9Q3DXP9_9BASI|nr:hypothetical protein [Austropuccinia psidii MF-1]
MEGAAPFRRGGMKSRREKSFYGSLGGYSGVSEGARAILGEVGDEEGEEFVEEEDYGELKWQILWQMLQRCLRVLLYPFLVNLLSLKLENFSSIWWRR